MCRQLGEPLEVLLGRFFFSFFLKMYKSKKKYEGVFKLHTMEHADVFQNDSWLRCARLTRGPWALRPLARSGRHDLPLSPRLQGFSPIRSAREKDKEGVRCPGASKPQADRLVAAE